MRKSIWALLLMCSLAAMPAWAQETRGNINGTIQDAQGVIPGANVTNHEFENGQTQSLVTNERLFRSAIAAGWSVSRRGRNAELQDAQPGRGAQRRPDAQREAHARSRRRSPRRVNVTAEAPILDTTSVSSGQNFDRALIEGLPMAANQPILLVEIRAGHRRPDHAAARASGADRRPERRRRRSVRAASAASTTRSTARPTPATTAAWRPRRTRT